MFFKKKKFVEIRWDDNSNQETAYTVTLVVTSIKPFKRSFFGVKNSPASFNFVPNAMEIIGEIKLIEGVQLNYKEAIFLVPEVDLPGLIPGDFIRLLLSKSGSCFKFEKIDRF